MGRHKKENFMTKFKNTVLTAFLVLLMLVWVQNYSNASGLKFAQISDDHFATNRSNTTFKMLAASPQLLDDAIEQINQTPNIDFVIFTGDLIDKPLEKELRAVLPHVNKLNYPWYFSFGNHDVCVGGYLTKSLYLSILRENNKNFNFDKPYYSFSPKKGYKVIVLDSIIDTEVTAHGNIYPEELIWLDNELQKSKNDIVLIFMHVPLVEPFNSPHHRMKNADEVKSVLQKYKNPIGVFTGHYHSAKIFQEDNILYVNSPSLVSYPNAFRIVNITTKKNKVIFNFQFNETNLKNVQKAAKIMVFSSTVYSGEKQDQSETYVIKR